MAFCMRCGAVAESSIPPNDSRQHIVCTQCDFIHYENPKVICGLLATWQDKVLLCRRAIEPRYGLWTLPAGFMEIGETMAEGANRECQEEAEGEGVEPQLYCLYDLPHIGQIYALYRGELKDGLFGAGSESLECALFAESDIPWDDLAFRAIQQTLKHFFHDRRTGVFPIHHEMIGLQR